MSDHDEAKTDPGGHEQPVEAAPKRTAQDRLRDELADWEQIPGAPPWLNDSDERQARRFALLAEVIADRDAAVTRRLDAHDVEIERLHEEIDSLKARVRVLEGGPDTHPAPPIEG